MIVKPHGGTLINRVLSEKEREAILSFKDKFVSLQIDEEKAITGEIKNFTGISDPFEEPEKPELIVETDKESAKESLQKILRKMEELGYLQPAANDVFIPEYLRKDLLKNLARQNFPDLSAFIIHILSQYIVQNSGGSEISQAEEDAAKEKLKKLGYLS